MDENIWQYKPGNTSCFQLHHDKMTQELVDYLFSCGLAHWPPRENAYGPDYIEVHARIGKAIMATIAIACAENEGMEVVTEFPEMHGSIIGRPRDMVLQTCLREMEHGGLLRRRAVAEFLVYKRCNVRNISAQDIAKLKSEKDALSDLRQEIERLANTLQENIFDEDTLQERLQDICNDIFRKWREDQANLSNFSRKLFGEGALAEPTKFLQEVAKSSFSIAGSGGVGAAATEGIEKTILHLNIPAAAEAGFAIGVAFRLITSFGALKKKARESPTRYLTTLAKHGVGFSVLA